MNEKLIEKYVKSKFEVVEQQSQPAELTDGDLNALRYAAGFVQWKLKKKFQKPTCNHPNLRDYLLCLT